MTRCGQSATDNLQRSVKISHRRTQSMCFSCSEFDRLWFGLIWEWLVEMLHHRKLRRLSIISETKTNLKTNIAITWHLRLTIQVKFLLMAQWVETQRFWAEMCTGNRTQLWALDLSHSGAMLFAHIRQTILPIVPPGLRQEYKSSRYGLWYGDSLGPLLLTLTLIPAWISHHMFSKVWDEITYPFPNFNGATVEVGNG